MFCLSNRCSAQLPEYTPVVGSFFWNIQGCHILDLLHIIWSSEWYLCIPLSSYSFVYQLLYHIFFEISWKWTSNFLIHCSYFNSTIPGSYSCLCPHSWNSEHLLPHVLAQGIHDCWVCYTLSSKVHGKDQRFVSWALVFKYSGGSLFLYNLRVNLHVHWHYTRHKIAADR